MSKKYVHILMALIGLLGVGATAEAQTRTEVVVTLPFEFVVDGETLPPGTYTVSRFTEDKLKGVILSNYKSGINVVVRPVEVRDASADMPQLSFQHVGEQRFLTSIRTSNDVYIIPFSRSTTLEASKSKDSGAVSGSSEGN